MARKRSGLSKKIRFEIFKRDKFACQYCGRKAPDVVLAVDHISPVAAGGADDLLNLVTSCVDCNSGKGARELSDDSALAKQRAELDRLAERREQIDMMVGWSRELQDSEAYEATAFCLEFSSLVDKQFFANERGQSDVRKWLNKFSLQELLSAARAATTQYLKIDGACRFTAESVQQAWASIPGIARFSKLPQSERDLYYVRGIVRNCLNIERGSMRDIECLQLLREAHAAGASIPWLKDLARTASSFSTLRRELGEFVSNKPEGS